MNLSFFSKYRHIALHDYLDEENFIYLERLFGRIKSFVKLLNLKDTSLESIPLSKMSDMSDLYHSYNEWREKAKWLRRNLARDNLVLPEGSMDLAFNPGELESLHCIARLCPRSGFHDHESWFVAVGVHLNLYKKCVDVSFKHASVQANIIDTNLLDTELKDKKDLILLEMSTYTWLLLKKEKEKGAIELIFNFPVKEIQFQVGEHILDMGLSAEKLGTESIADELILKNLEKNIIRILDERSNREIIESAKKAYLDLISAKPDYLEKDPLSLGFEKYKKHIDEKILLEELDEIKNYYLLKKRKGKLKDSPRKRKPIETKKLKSVTPLARTMSELKPGMELEGKVTNTTRFGAFVNVGLPVEGMIHISQLSNEYVEEPSDVVRVGQKVIVWVLEVSPEKKRIALTLRPMDTLTLKGRSDSPVPRKRVSKSRSAALASLDALFKK